jgi:hypothetical protein
MKIKVGNLFDSKDMFIFVTANSYITTKGDLVMGRGAALELATRYPDLKSEFGSIIKEWCGHLGVYGTLVIPVYNEHSTLDNRQTYGIFQVKKHFKNLAELDLIKISADMLNKNPLTISMNFPGIGNGGLKAKDVLPIIEFLDDNVTVYVRDLDDLS